MEAQRSPHDPLPHWGKLFSLSPEKVRAGYARMDDFRGLAAKLDPGGKFRNAFVDKYILGK